MGLETSPLTPTARVCLESFPKGPQPRSGHDAPTFDNVHSHEAWFGLPAFRSESFTVVVDRAAWLFRAVDAILVVALELDLENLPGNRAVVCLSSRQISKGW